MAGGIDWFRWHHGSVTDQKFPLVARRAGASVAEVIAVWACLLERASMNEQERGFLGDGIDFEAMDCALGMDDGKAESIFDSLRQRSLIDVDNKVTAWAKRQPKREREDTTAADRKRNQRSRESEAIESHVTPSEASENHVTPCHATSHQKTPREEKSREELKTYAQPVGFAEFWSAYPKRRNRGDAEKAWRALKPDASMQARILEAVEVAKRRDDWRKDGGQFIPYPASWLRAKGWDDEATPVPAASPAGIFAGAI